jgi:hypothetical protein
LRITSAMPSESAGLIACGATGGSASTCISTSASVAPWNGGTPVAMW